MDAFRFELTDQEKDFLKDLARGSIAARLAGQASPDRPTAPTPRMREPLGAFVTLHLDGRLRGCIGRIVGDRPLDETIASMALSAAFEDPRFPPLTAAEFPDIRLEVSILGPITPCPDPSLVEVGRHGLIVRRGHRQGLLLPQVPVEWGWGREEFLSQTCRKAGLAPEDWKRADTELYWFEAVVF